MCDSYVGAVNTEEQQATESSRITVDSRSSSYNNSRTIEECLTLLVGSTDR